MKRFGFPVFLLASVLSGLIVPVQVHAAPVRVFVASTGADVNVASGCALATPCRTFANALPAVAPGGEVVVLDTAGYGPAAITQSVSIVAPKGVFAGVFVPSNADGFRINAPGASVVLKGLSIIGDFTGANGINILSAQSVRVEDCEFEKLTNGISYGAAPTALSALTVAGSTFVFNGHAVNLTFTLPYPGFQFLTARIERSNFEFDSYGIWAQDGVDLSVSDTTLHNELYAIRVETVASGGFSQAKIDRVHATANFYSMVFSAASNPSGVNAFVSRSTLNGEYFANSGTEVGLDASGIAGGRALVAVDACQFVATDNFGVMVTQALVESNGNNVFLNNVQDVNDVSKYVSSTLQ